MSNPRLDVARSKMERLDTELKALLAQHGEDEATWPAGVMERSNRLVRGMDKATEEFDALSARGDRIEAIRQAAMDPRNVEAGCAGGRDAGVGRVRLAWQHRLPGQRGRSAVPCADRLRRDGRFGAGIACEARRDGQGGQVQR